MRFEWDEEKNFINIRKHGFDFSQAEQMKANRNEQNYYYKQAF
jgi:uncharacterized DUF497 family protein